MRRASLQLKRYASNVQIVDSGNLERRVLQLLLISLCGLALLYTLILGNMVWNIVQRRGLETRAHTLSGEVAELELSYMALASKVDLKLGETLGFRETEAQFTVRKSVGFSGNSLSLVTNEL